jgi:ABC-type sulfate/molybdate transport systems ATPase subunit
MINEAQGEDLSHQNKNNLWSKIRADVQKRDDLHDANLILLGDKGAGKRSILREIN